jgi:hypothetical protein
VYTASRRPAQHSAAIDNNYGAEVILSTICSHSRWRIEEDNRVINLRFSSGLILCCEGTANWSVQWSVQDYIRLNNSLDIYWNKYLKKKAVIVSLPTWLGTQKPTYLNSICWEELRVAFLCQVVSDLCLARTGIADTSLGHRWYRV